MMQENKSKFQRINMSLLNVWTKSRDKKYLGVKNLLKMFREIKNQIQRCL